ncbi:MAG TPA: FecR domain-containing protein [Mucilaginibacter sp.]|nr:FecR domain-containing protein [Mucilaginibacter sp.]
MWENIEARKPKRKTARLWPRIAAAASIAIAIGVGSLFYVNWHNKHKVETVAKNDVDPGHMGATLTLANGQQIRLAGAANGQIARQAGVRITKTQNGQLVYEIEAQPGGKNTVNTLSTANGETYQVRLPDGSAVWLNSASSLTYHADLVQSGKRTVRLKGEAYFEVAKDKAHPFVVQTASQEVEVLGTHFNINSYADEPATATTLLEGSVKVTAGNVQQVIKPGEQALNTDGNLRVAQADLDHVTDWKDGDFNLEHVDLRVALRKIARWYDVDVQYDPQLPEQLQTGGWISRNKKLSAILEVMEASGQVHFKLEGRRLYVSR